MHFCFVCFNKRFEKQTIKVTQVLGRKNAVGYSSREKPQHSVNGEGVDKQTTLWWWILNGEWRELSLPLPEGDERMATELGGDESGLL